MLELILTQHASWYQRWYKCFGLVLCLHKFMPHHLPSGKVNNLVLLFCRNHSLSIQTLGSVVRTAFFSQLCGVNLKELPKNTICLFQVYRRSLNLE